MDYVIFDWITVFWGVVALLFTFVLSTVVLIAVVATLPPTFLQARDSCMVGASANPVPHYAPSNAGPEGRNGPVVAPPFSFLSPLSPHSL